VASAISFEHVERQASVQSNPELRICSAVEVVGRGSLTARGAQSFDGGGAGAGAGLPLPLGPAPVGPALFGSAAFGSAAFGSAGMLPSFATHLLKYSRWASEFPFLVPGSS
jgi:hypothetical protein